MWTITVAREVCQRLNAFLHDIGFGVGLTGSVLMLGKSRKDLDLIIYPLNSNVCDYRALREELHRFGWSRYASAGAVKERWKRLGSDDEKNVEVWLTSTGARVDLFLLK